MKGAAQFFLDTLVEEPTHKWLVTCPSLSPENQHPSAASICAGPAMDSQILRDLFANTHRRRAESRPRCRLARSARAATRAALPPDQIGKAGQLQEWLEDWDMQAPEREPPPRLAPLRALPERADQRAAHAGAGCGGEESLEMRGDLSTGWAIAWRINLWARLRDAEHTHGVIEPAARPRRAPTRTCSTRIRRSRSTATSAAPNGITEMLMQSVGGEIELLPALPRAWPTGSVRGLRARGGFEVDIDWRNGELTTARVTGTPGGQAVLRYGETTRRVRAGRGRTVSTRWGCARQAALAFAPRPAISPLDAAPSSLVPSPHRVGVRARRARLGAAKH